MGMSIKEAASLWVSRDMWAIPIEAAEKLIKYSGYNDFCEITPISTGVTVWSGEHQRSGEVVKVECNKDGDEIILVDFGYEEVECKRDNLDREDSGLPMWGCLWAFSDMCDKDWIDNEQNRVKMAELGFRIYNSEDYGYVFGIDGAGYDFYHEHWIPLYKARGLRWHDEE